MSGFSGFRLTLVYRMARKSPQCDSDAADSEQRYYPYTIILCLLVVLQIILFAHTIYHSQYNSVKSMRLCFIIMQLLIIFWGALNILMYTVDPYTFIIQHSILCKVSAYAVFHPVTIVYGLHLFQIQKRLEMSFSNSALKQSTFTVRVFRVLIAFVIVTYSIALSVDGFDANCIAQWRATDLEQPLTYCKVPISDMFAFRYHVVSGCVLMIVTLKIVLAGTFTLKLKKLISNTAPATNPTNSNTTDSTKGPKASSSDILEQFKLQALVVKNNILAVAGCVSTTVGYLMFYVASSSLLLHVDLLINRYYTIISVDFTL